MGTLRWVKNTCVPHSDNQGVLLSYDGLIQDITDRKQAEEALRASEEWFRTIANFTYDWETWIGTGRNFLYVSPSCERMTGYPPQAFYHDPDLLLKMTHPDDYTRVQTHFHEEFTNEDVHFLNFRILTSAGVKNAGLVIFCQAIYSDAGEWLGRRSSNRDITEQKQSEEALALSEARLRQIIDLVPHQIFVRDRQGCYGLVNKTAAASRGITPEQMQGKCYSELPGIQARRIAAISSE